MSKKKNTVTLRKALSLRHHNIFVLFLKIFIVPWAIRFLRMHADMSHVKHIAGPYILIAHHLSVLDPMIIYKFKRLHIHFVVTDAAFRNPLMKLFLSMFGSISKKKNQRDNQTIKDILYVLLVKKEPVCIFASGVNTWDGKSSSLVRGTASLLKIAKVPVLLGQTHGAYLTRPRWGHQIRRGKINIKFTELFSKKDINNLTRNEIHDKLSTAFNYNEFDKQKIYPITFPSPTRAEYIERVLFACPHCLQTQTIHSHKQFFHCTNCQYEWFMNQQGFFQTQSSTFQSSLMQHTSSYKNKTHNIIEINNNLVAWNAWQKTFISEHLSKFKKNEIIFYDEKCILRYGVSRLCLSLGMGRVTLTNTHIHFFPENPSIQEVRFDLSKLIGVNVQNNEKLEWTIGKITYQILPKNLRINTYKYMIAMNTLSQH